MSVPRFTESIVEEAALEWLQELGYAYHGGEDLAPDAPLPQRGSFRDVVLVDRLQDAVDRLNPHIPVEARSEATRKLLRAESPDLVSNNRRVHQFLIDGVDVEYRRADGSITDDKVWL